MKTKIIYISGNEVFEMSEIRAAFDKVRSALGLGNDTILFGVPVDNDNALENNDNLDAQTENLDCCAVDAKPQLTEQTDFQEITIPEIIEETVQSPVCEDISESIDEMEMPIENDIEETIDAAVEAAPEDETEIESKITTAVDTIKDDEPAEENEEKIIPILSVLAVNQEFETDNAPEVPSEAEEVSIVTVITNEPQAADETFISDISIDAPVPDNMFEDAHKVTIGDMIDEEAPVAPMKQTLEQLLESMTPLREDLEHSATQDTVTDETTAFDMNETDTDATLAQLASEFAENEDKIVTNTKTEPQGKIGKLKNILPFKKVKRDDSSLMGDLFGWAGIAANDDDFTMPGFFTGAKTQGA